jgi:hypothetical protein
MTFPRAAVLMLAVATVSLADTRPLNDMSPIDAGFGVGGVANSSRGWRFQVNDNIVVTEFGASTPHPEGDAFSLMLWNFATQTKLAQLDFISDGSDDWQWASLSSPLALSAGGQYIMSIYTVNAHYYFQSIGGPWQPTGTIQYLDMRFANSASDNTFPTNTLTGYQYGVPDFGYHLATPEPSTYGLMTLGAAGLMLARRRGRRSK